VTAEFDPNATPPVVPTPTDLALRGGGGTLNIPDLPTDSPAQRSLNAYLRTLNGFPTSSTASARFSAPLDPASVAAGQSVLVIDLTTRTPLDPAAVTATVTDSQIVITPTQRWTPGHTFGVAVFGGQDPNGVRGAGGEQVIASPTFFFLRSARPLVDVCEDPLDPACVCTDPTLASCHSVTAALTDAQARAAETERRQLDPVLTQLVDATGRARNDVVLFWTFTTTTMPTAVFDPQRGDIVFPNDLLINQMTGLVNLPIAPNDPQASVKMQLNTLDGFSTTAPITVPLELAAGSTIDPATVVAGQTVLLVNLDPRPTAVQPEFRVSAVGNQLVIEPTAALIPDQSRYAVIVTSAVKDQTGSPLRPPPTLVLLAGEAPLFAGGRSTVSSLTDAQAAQLEQLRVAYAPLFMRLAGAGVPKEALAMAATFTTQSIARPLAALAAFPSTARDTGLNTSVRITTVANEEVLAARAAQLPFPTTNLRAIVLGTYVTENVTNGSEGRVELTRTPTMPGVPQADRFAVVASPTPAPEPVRFWMSIPRTSGGGPLPVVILQHGLNSWRGAMVGLADAFAAAGFAAIAIDIPLHGARSRCTADAQCSGGCDVSSGMCRGEMLPMPTAQDPLACSLQPLSGDAADCRPMASGAAFIDPRNLFRTRANGEQYVVDAVQLLRVLGDANNPAGLQATLSSGGGSPIRIDTERVTFLGISLGGIAGTVLFAASPAPRLGVFNATGGRLFDILTTGDLRAAIEPFLMSSGITPGTPAFFQLRTTATWILDLVDPFAIGQLIVRRPLASGVPKRVILQTPGRDTVIPPPFQSALARELFGPAGLDAMGNPVGQNNAGDRVSTFFPDGEHATLLTGRPPATAASMRRQAFELITSAGERLPSP
jgi:hypothetical protein